jgi:molecular chaperone GrpE (heat shock protein)
LQADSDQTYFEVIVIGQTSNERLNPPTCRAHLSAEKSRLEDEIKRLVDSRKRVEADVSLKKKSITEKKRYYKKFRVKKRRKTHWCQLE